LNERNINLISVMISVTYKIEQLMPIFYIIYNVKFITKTKPGGTKQGREDD
jgi:hypothetical protein